MLRIRDVYPGTGSRIRIRNTDFWDRHRKHLSQLTNNYIIILSTREKWSLSSQKRGLGNRDLDKTIPDHGSRGQKSTGSRHEHCFHLEDLLLGLIILIFKCKFFFSRYGLKRRKGHCTNVKIYFFLKMKGFSHVTPASGSNNSN